jgi:1,4-alpha-glucan branching enzyme
MCLVLHGHLPYVLRHGLWPHGEDWLYEAAAETYLPLLAVIDECNFFQAPAHATIGLTPVLLEQLACEDFKAGFERYLQDRVDQGRADEAEFKKQNQPHLAYLAERWQQWYGQTMRQFSDLGRDIPGAYAQRAKAGLVELLTSAATHAYLPLLYEDSSIRAQIRAGVASSKRILGMAPAGMWLPECAYRPGGPWSPPVAWGAKANRLAVERMVDDEGIGYFFLEHHLIESARSEWARDSEWRRVGWDEAAKDPRRGWGNVHEPVLVNSDGTGPGRVAAFGRDMPVCERVWSGTIGYPAHGRYLEFHKRHSPRRGLRYWKITGPGVGLGAKDPYYPDDVPGILHEHATDFCNYVKAQLWEHRNRTGRHGVVVAAFDAELFGHWWFEGPRFLADVIKTLNADPDVDLQTAGEFLHSHPPDKTVAVSEGSWGEKGDRRVWANDKVNWMWDIEYRCEATLGRMTFETPWQSDAQIRALLQDAARELLLLQASDWQFIISRGQAVDYGIKRFMLHVSRFEMFIDLCEKLKLDSSYLGKISPIERHEVEDARLHDVIFPEIDLNWWRMEAP